MASFTPEGDVLRTLRHVAYSIYKSGNTDELTVKRVRRRAEEELGLPQDHLKSGDWKQKSESCIRKAVESFDNEEPPSPLPKPAPKPTKAKVAKTKPVPKKKASSDSPRGQKRKSAIPAKKPQKRRKTESSEDELDEAAPVEDVDASHGESEVPKKPVRRGKRVVEEDTDEEEGTAAGAAVKANPGADEEEDEPATPLPKEDTTAGAKGDVSESELSSLIDESPVKKRRQKKSGSEKSRKESKSKSSKPTSEAKPKAKGKAKGAQDDDPDQAEIKRLQSWLVKCGIRKVWSKALAKCDTTREKIRHLKDMLQDAGMEGRFSEEKAAKIKLQREFAKDLEDIQQGEQAWGNTGADDGGRPRRRAAARAATKPVVVQHDDEDEDGSEKQESGEDDEDDNEDFNDDDDDQDGGTEGETSEEDEEDDMSD